MVGKYITILLLAASFIAVPGSYAAKTPGAKAKPIEPGMQMPPVLLPAPDSEQIRNKLGLKTEEPFLLSQIPAKFLLVEVFYVLCHSCQKQAPDLNRIYQYIQEDPNLARDIKMFGIAIHSDQRSLDAYAASFRVKFPIVRDPDLTAFSALGDPPIPFLMLVDNTGKVLLTRPGYLKDADEFFRQVRELHKKNEQAVCTDPEKVSFRTILH